MNRTRIGDLPLARGVFVSCSAVAAVCEGAAADDAFAAAVEEMAAVRA